MDPIFNGYQLLGDSQFVRFSEQLLQFHATKNEHGAWNIGACVSGQTIQELTVLVDEYETWLEENLIVMIGTNNLKRLRNDSYSFWFNLEKLANRLRRKNVTFLTLPPIPRFENNQNYKVTYRLYNNYIFKLRDSHGFRVLDISDLYLDWDSKIKIEYFEKCFYNGKTDLIHLNRNGLTLLRDFLLESLPEIETL